MYSLTMFTIDLSSVKAPTALVRIHANLGSMPYTLFTHPLHLAQLLIRAKLKSLPLIFFTHA